jgi:uncharacterized protein
MAQEVRSAPPSIADPAALGLGGFALTTFVLSAHNAGWAPDVVWIGLALFYGGIAQFSAGMWEFRKGNTFGATAFGTYGMFWMSLATFVLLALFGKAPANTVDPALGWFILGFAIFNTYMMLWSLRVNMAVFGVFLTLEVTEILLVLGFLMPSTMFVQLGGYVGIVTAAVAWYASAAVVVNSLGPKPVLPVGRPMWGGAPSAPESPATRPVVS